MPCGRQEREGGRAGSAKRNEKDKDYHQVRAASDSIGNGAEPQLVTWWCEE